MGSMEADDAFHSAYIRAVTSHEWTCSVCEKKLTFMATGPDFWNRVQYHKVFECKTERDRSEQPVAQASPAKCSAEGMGSTPTVPTIT